jgi:hypothetical protein
LTRCPAASSEFSGYDVQGHAEQERARVAKAAADEKDNKERAEAGVLLELSNAMTLTMLKDPNSVSFGNISVYKDRKFKGASVLVACGSVNPKNSFNGYTGVQDFVAIPSRKIAAIDNPSGEGPFSGCATCFAWQVFPTRAGRPVFHNIRWPNLVGRP